MSGTAEYIEWAVTCERRGHTEASPRLRLAAMHKDLGAVDILKRVADGLKQLQTPGAILEVKKAWFTRVTLDTDIRVQMALPTGAWGKLPVPEVVNG
jgi:hypothetical protein